MTGTSSTGGSAEPSFDAYSDRYEEAVSRAVAFSGQEHSFFMSVKAHKLLALVERCLGAPGEVRALDLGCGTGGLHPFLAPRLGALVGADPSTGSIATAAERGSGSSLVGFDGRYLPFHSSSFDLVVVQCVLHHVPPPSRTALVAEAVRVLRPRGLLTVIEHNPFNPLTRLAVSRCEFDRDARLLRASETRRLLRRAGLAVAASDYFLFTPWRSRAFRRLEEGIGWLPLGAQYLVAGRVAGRSAGERSADV